MPQQAYGDDLIVFSLEEESCTTKADEWECWWIKLPDFLTSFFYYYFLFEKKVFKDHHVEFVFLLLVACTYTIIGHVIACLPACVRNPVVVQLINSREEGETTAKLNSNHDKDGVIITSSWVLSLDKGEKAEKRDLPSHCKANENKNNLKMLGWAS